MCVILVHTRRFMNHLDRNLILSKDYADAEIKKTHIHYFRLT